MGSRKKMVLVIEEPESCRDCDLQWVEGAEEGGCYCCTEGFSTEEYSKRRPPNCPLKYLPEKLPTEGKEPLKRAAGYAYGYNDCIDEIGGKDAESNVERDPDCPVKDA